MFGLSLIQSRDPSVSDAQPPSLCAPAFQLDSHGTASCERIADNANIKTVQISFSFCVYKMKFYINANSVH